MRGCMKKSGILAAVCFLAVLCAIPVITLRINREKEEIQITEVPLSGDPEEAEGLCLEYSVHWDRKLLWDTVYLPGSGREAKSRFSFSSEEAVWPERAEDGIQWMTAGGWGMSGSGGIDLDEVYFSALVKSAADRVQPGETQAVEVRLADYYDYYPFCLSVTSERYNLYYGLDFQMEAGIDVLARQIALPVSEEERVLILIRKDEAGNCVEVNCQNQTAGSGGLYFEEEARRVYDSAAEREIVRTLDGAFAEQGFYLGYAFSLEEKKEGGWGIFYLPYTEEPEARGRYSMAAYSGKTLDTGRCRRVWEAENSGIELTDMAWDEEAGLLYLVGVEEGKENLYVLQKEGEELSLLQRIFIADPCEAPGTEIWGGMKRIGDGLLLTWERGSMGRGCFVFLTREDGVYSVFCRGNFPGISEESSEEYASLFPWEYCGVFDGERLALAAFDTWQSTDVWLEVFRREGMTYSGRYEHSGARERGNSGISEIYPQGLWRGQTPRSNQPLKLRLEGQADL